MMTTEKAIQLLQRISDSQFDGIHGDERREALEMAVRALSSQQTDTDSQGLVNDCISRQAAIIVFENSGLDDDSKDTAVRVLEQLPSAQSQWIPCSERLPEKNGKYLITGRQGAVNVLLFEDGRWYGRWGVVAWMPLPKGYKGE